MVTLLSQILTPAEYLSQEETSELRHEYHNGEIIPMAGGTTTHNELVGALYSILRRELRGKPFQPFFTDQRLWIPQSQSYYYPDVMVVPKPVRLLEGRKDTVMEPVLVAEVLSDSTQDRDRAEKFLSYRQIPTFEEYLLIDQDKLCVEQFTKQSPSQWLLNVWSAPEQVITLSAIGVALSLGELYENVEFGAT